MRPALAVLGAALATALAVSAVHARGGDLQVRNAWIPLPPAGASDAVAYLDIVNSGKRADRLLGAACPCAARVERRETGAAGAGAPVSALEVAPSRELRLAPQGEHLALRGLKAPLRLGEPVPLTLSFERAGKITVEALVKRPPLGGME